MSGTKVKAIQGALVILTAFASLVTPAALPIKSKGALLLTTNAIAFRSNVTETEHIGAEVYLHRRDKNGFRLAQFIDAENGSPYALMSFPMSFGITSKVGQEMVDLSFDFHLEQAGARSVTYYSSDLKQTVHLPPRPIAFAGLHTPNMHTSTDELRRRAGNVAHQDQQHFLHHYLPNYLTTPDDASSGVRVAANNGPTISVAVKDACAQPMTNLTDLQLSCTPVRYGQTQDVETNNAPKRGDPKWLWRATRTTQMRQTSPGVFTGSCDMSSLAAATHIYETCTARLRDTGDGFKNFCHPMQNVLDLREDLLYTIAHQYTGEYVALSRFLSSIRRVFSAYERACTYYQQPELHSRVDVQLAAEECGHPPEIALEVRSKGVSQMLGSMGAAQGDFTATITASKVPPKGGCPR